MPLSNIKSKVHLCLGSTDIVMTSVSVLAFV